MYLFHDYTYRGRKKQREQMSKKQITYTVCRQKEHKVQ